MARRCDVHGLAVAPEGHCTLCVREASRARTQRWAFAVAAGSFFAVVAVCAAAAVRSAARAPRASEPLVPELVAGPSEPSPHPADPTPHPTLVVPTAPLPPPGVHAPGVTAPLETAPLEPPPAHGESSALEAARRDVSITIYSASWCGYCKKAKAFMDARGLAYAERDVDDDETAAKELRAISPKGSIPSFKIDRETMVGWSQSGLLAAIDRAAKRRLTTKP